MNASTNRARGFLPFWLSRLPDYQRTYRKPDSSGIVREAGYTATCKRQRPIRTVNECNGLFSSIEDRTCFKRTPRPRLRTRSYLKEPILVDYDLARVHAALLQVELTL